MSFSDDSTHSCQIVCSRRKNKWTHVFPSIYRDYAMLREKCFIDLPSKTFLVYQINEHSRGGHHEFEVQLMDVNGHVLNEFSSRENIDFILDKNNLWFLKTGKSRYDLSKDIDLDLIRVNIRNGQVKNCMNLNYEKLLDNTYKIVIAAKLSEKRNKMMLKIQYKDEQNKTQSKHIPLSSSIFR